MRDVEERISILRLAIHTIYVYFIFGIRTKGQLD